MIIGKIVSVNFDQFKVKISTEIKGSSVNINGDIYYFGNIGSYLKSSNAIGETIICEVVSIFDNDMHQEKRAFNIEGNRELMLKPIGTINRKNIFSLGVGIFPSLYSDVSIVTQTDMKTILQTSEIIEVSPNIHKNFLLGVSKNLINYPISISIDRFFNIHSAVLGNTGSGKSNTIAHIIQEIHKYNDYDAIGSKILLFDVNGEYKEAFPSNKSNPNLNIKFYKPNISKSREGYEPFYLPHFLMNLEEWGAFLLATDATQKPFWDKVLQECYRFYKIATAENDSEKELFVNYLRYKLCFLIYTVLNQADTDTANITAASSVISSIKNIINSDKNLTVVCKESELEEDIDVLLENCGVAYGNNHGKLKEMVDLINKKVDPSKVLMVMNKKLKHSEEYYHYKFLKVAANLTLLEEDARGNKRMREYTSTMLTRLDYFLGHSDCKFMRPPQNDINDSVSYLDDLWHINEKSNEKSQLIIIDTSELSPDALETLTSVVSRLIFSDRKKLQGEARRKGPVHLILDEAHRYIHKEYKYILRENIFEKIAREGRKYSVYLLVSSQRPSELSETVLSQCANFIIHRIQNENDMRYINAILPYFSSDFVNKIKQSTPGEALIFGNCVPMPLHVKVLPAAPEPNSKNCVITKEWFKPLDLEEEIDDDEDAIK